ncbi:MAG TPA: DNA translocase FtsK, partial [Abditibacteriaceae bacterium]|nr:DNA translocase FtsK [Abditibacteriaceae bacterium]
MPRPPARSTSASQSRLELSAPSAAPSAASPESLNDDLPTTRRSASLSQRRGREAAGSRTRTFSDSSPLNDEELDAFDASSDDLWEDAWDETADSADKRARSSSLASNAVRNVSITNRTSRPSMLREAARRAASSAEVSSAGVSSAPSSTRLPARASLRSTGGRSSRTTKSGGTRPSSSARSSSVPSHTPRALWYEIGGVLSLAVGALLLWNARLATPQISGTLPHLTLGVLRALFGIGSVVIPLLLCALGVLLIVKHHRTNLRAFGRGALVAFLVLLTGVHLAVPHGREFLDHDTIASHGGYLGGAMSWLLRRMVGPAGAIIMLAALSLVALLLWSELSLAQTLSRGRSLLRQGKQAVRSRLSSRRSASSQNQDEDSDEQWDGDWQDPQDLDKQPSSTRRTPRALPSEAAKTAIEYSNAAQSAQLSPDTTPHRPIFLPVDELLAGETAPLPPSFSHNENATQVPVEPPKEPSPKIEFTDAPPPVSVLNPVLDSTGLSPETKTDDELTPTEKLEAQALATATEGEAPTRKPRIERPRRRFGEGPLMPEYFDDAVRALDPPVVPDLEGAEDDIHQGVKAVTETLASFKIDARVTDVKRGPVITRYEVQPAPGVRVATIAALDRDMSRALSAIAVRIEAPVPGKDVIGIEVPNKRVNLVRLRDVLERHDFLSTQSKLSFVLGKDIAGQPKWADLTKMPHMLVAGATNSGKSVCLNSIIASILVRATPEEVKLSLIDPKRVELTLYKDIPHLYHPVVVEPKDAVRALRGAIAEMDRRYRRFAERGVRNIASYNSKLAEDEAPLPYIVIVIDELADLMMTAAAEFEKLICRLAQLARATGIHLIVATQRPSVNVITGVIKANIPARIAFAVASQVDSRTILDCVGAERLIGSGDMLYDSNGAKPTRIQGSFLSEEEVHRLVEAVKTHYMEDGPIEYGMDLEAFGDQGSSDGEDDSVEEKRDDLYDTIREFVIRNTEMSASMIQRKFEIGYPR